MTSGKKARQQRRTPAPPPVRSTGGPRRASPKVLAAGAVVIALAAVAAALAFALTGGSSSPSSNTTASSTLPDAGSVVRMFKRIPQHGNVLGSAKAPVTMVEYIDLQCPICRAFETGVMPTIVPRFVRPGKVRVIARPIAFIGPDSERGRRAAIAASRQDHFFDFAQLLYDNQGQENSGWLDAQFVRSAFASIPGLNAAAALKASDSSTVTAQATHFDDQANADQVKGTPTVLVGRTGGKLTEVVSPDVGHLSTAIQNALKS
jgi:protein-disulfide isomerase